VRTLHNGWQPIATVPTGTHVLSVDPLTGTLSHSPIVAWWHHEAAVPTPYVRLTAASGQQLTLSSAHYLHASPGGCTSSTRTSGAWRTSATLMLSRDVRVGDGLWVVTRGGESDGDALHCSPVASIDAVVLRGRYAPVTAAGNLVVEHVSASSLVAFGRVPTWLLKAHHALLVRAHALLGQLGLSLLDALHAPFYRARGVPQPTNRAVARALAQKTETHSGGAATPPVPHLQVFPATQPYLQQPAATHGASRRGSC
jgi:hypothetical protein